MAEKIHEMDIVPEEELGPVNEDGIFARAHLGLKRTLKISYGTLLEFYAGLRLLGYYFQDFYKPFRDHILNKALAKDETYQQLGRDHEYAHNMLHNERAAKAGEAYVNVSKEGVSKAARTLPAANTIAATSREMESIREKAMIGAKHKINIVEIAAFGAWTVFNFGRDRKRLKSHLAEAVAAETGIPPEKVGLWDLWKSKNPIIESTMHRFAYQNVARLAPLPLFWKDLKYGVLGIIGVITLERSMFNVEDSYDLVRRTVRKIDDNHLTGRVANTYTRGSIVENLQVAIQRVRRDHGLAIISVSQMETLRPVLDRIAHAVLERDMKTADVVYLLGQMTKHPNDIKGLERELNNVQTIGLRGIANWRSGKTVFPAAPIEQLEKEGRPDNKALAQTLEVTKEPVQETKPEEGKIRKVLKQNGPLSPMERATSQEPSSGLAV